jgi:hypothetical protein
MIVLSVGCAAGRPLRPLGADERVTLALREKQRDRFRQVPECERQHVAHVGLAPAALYHAVYRVLPIDAASAECPFQPLLIAFDFVLVFAAWLGPAVCTVHT